MPSMRTRTGREGAPERDKTLDPVLFDALWSAAAILLDNLEVSVGHRRLSPFISVFVDISSVVSRFFKVGIGVARATLEWFSDTTIW